MWVMICICFCLLMSMIGGTCWFWKNLPEGLSRREIFEKKIILNQKKAFWLEFWYPPAYRIYVLFQKKKWLFIDEEKLNLLQKVCVGQKKEVLRELYFCQRLAMTFWLLTGIALLSMIGLLSETQEVFFDGGYQLIREEPGGGQRQISLEAEVEGEKKEIHVIIAERQYTAEETKAKMEEAKEYILLNYLGENSSEESVSKSLNLMSQIPDSQIQVEWKLDSNGYINKDGTLNQEKLTEITEVSVIAILSYGEKKEKISVFMNLVPQKKSEKELFWEEWDKALNVQQMESGQEKVLSLPREVKGKVISYAKENSSTWLGIFIVGLLGGILVPSFLDYRTEQRIIQREEQLQKEYPELVERFILLIGAGLSIRGVWYRISEDYEKRYMAGEREKHYLYEEMLVTKRALENGQNEAVAYADFGRRLSLIQYMRFQTLLAQNLKKGSSDLLQRMDYEAQNALRERRELAKKLGEEAGTKLLIPMMLMLVIVFAMILIAAFQNL